MWPNIAMYLLCWFFTKWTKCNNKSLGCICDIKKIYILNSYRRASLKLTIYCCKEWLLLYKLPDFYIRNINYLNRHFEVLMLIDVSISIFRYYISFSLKVYMASMYPDILVYINAISRNKTKSNTPYSPSVCLI